jgi:hypothetical protein
MNSGITGECKVTSDEYPVFIPAYDTEHDGACLEACRKIARVHRDRGIPATFFIVGRLLQSAGRAFRELLDEPGLFEIASHTYSHMLLRDQPVAGRAVGPAAIHEEIFRGKQLVEDCFERPCLGMRPGCCFELGFRGLPEVLQEIASAGFRYVSSRAWGPHSTVPAPLVQAYNYAEEGFADLWEFPGHGWHENVLKGHNATPGRLLLWPPLYPEQQFAGYVKTPEEEFSVHRFFVDRAVAERLEYVSLIWHPWSLAKFDPAMRMLGFLFDHVRRQGLAFSRFEDLWRKRASTGQTPPPATP